MTPSFRWHRKKRMYRENSVRVPATLTLGTLLLWTAHPALSEDVAYDLSQYRTGDLYRNELVLSGNFNSSRDQGETWNHPENDLETRSDTESSAWSHLGALNLSFTRLVELSRKIRTTHGYFAFQPSYNKDEQLSEASFSETASWSDDRELSRWGHVIFAGFGGSHRQYVADQLFWEFGLDLDGGVDWRNVASDREVDPLSGDVTRAEQETSSNSRNASLEGDVSMGWGRLYPLFDVRAGLYILDGLSDSGVLSREPTDEDVESLGNRIRQIRNARVFDSREKRTYEMRQLVDFLQERGLVEGLDVETFTTIDDRFRYANNPARYSGTEVKVSFSGRRTESRVTDDEIRRRILPVEERGITYRDRERSGTEDRMWARIDFTCEVPLSKRLQWSNRAWVSLSGIDDETKVEDHFYGDQEERRVKSSSHEDDEELRLSGSVGLAYYPNSRDEVAANLVATYRDLDETSTVRSATESERRRSERETNAKSLDVALSWTRTLSFKTQLDVTLSSGYDRYEAVERRTLPVETPVSVRGWSSWDTRVSVGYSYSIL